MSSGDSRIPFRATTGAASYEAIRPLPVRVLLENVRSLYNVGAFFRTADPTAIEKLHLAGITGYPPQNMISKTALGAENTVAWEHTWKPEIAIRELREANLRDRRHRDQRACGGSVRLATALPCLRAVRP